MTTYDTGNPVPSADARDRYDNSQTFDQVINGPLQYYPNRIGANVLSLAGMRLQFDAAQADRADRFDAAISNVGYEVVGDYAVQPVTFIERNQVMLKGGEYWKPKASTALPYVTSGTWASESANFVSVGDAALRQELSFDTGAAMVGVGSPDGLLTSVQDVVGSLIIRSMTVAVPADFASPGAAMDWLRGFTISRQALVTIQVANGVYTLTEGINLNHPQGEQIRLIGNQLDPSLCVLTVADGAGFDAMVCSGGRGFGFVDGFHITRPTKAEMPYNTTGLLAVQNSTIVTGEKVKVSNWFYGIAARDASFVYCPKAEVLNAGDVGIWAFCGSTVVCHGSVSNFASAAGNPWGFGFQAEYGSVLVGTSISATGCKIAGVAALSNSVCRLDAAEAIGNTGSGFFARDDGVIEAITGTVSGNSRYGIEVVEGNGRIFGNIVNAGNTLGTANPFVYISAQAGQAQLRSSSGPLRVDSQGDTFFNTPGGLQFAIRDIANAANRIDMAGAAAGAAPVIIAAGRDANINLKLSPKGTGRVQLTATAPGVPTVNSYIEVLASDGAVCRIPVERL